MNERFTQMGRWWRALLVASVGACFFPLGSVASAQSFPQPNPLIMIDKNGVDEASGMFDMPQLSVTAGGDESGIGVASILQFDNYYGYAEEIEDTPYIYEVVSYGDKVYRFAVADYVVTSSAPFTVEQSIYNSEYANDPNITVLGITYSESTQSHVCHTQRYYPRDSNVTAVLVGENDSDAQCRYIYDITTRYYYYTLRTTSTFITPYGIGIYKLKGNNGDAATLSYNSNDGVYTLTLSNGDAVNYSHGFLASIYKANGERIFITYYKDSSGNIITDAPITSVSYFNYATSVGSSSGVLQLASHRPVKQAVYSTLGWGLKFDVDANDGYKTKKITAFNRSLAYCAEMAATCSGLSSHTQYETLSTSGSQTTLAHNGIALLNYTSTLGQAIITSPLGVTKVVNKEVVNYAGSPIEGRVSSVVIGNSTWKYEFLTGSTFLNYQTNLTNPDSYSKTIKYTLYGPSNTTDSLNRQTQYKFYAPTTGNRISDVISPEGSAAANSNGYYPGSTHYTYDDRGNITEVRQVAKDGSAADIIQTESYDTTCSNPKTCNQPNYMIDALGNRTDYTYDTTTGQVLTETGPADANGVRPQKRYSYTWLYAKVKDASGNLVNAEAPISKLTKVSICRMATAADPASCVGTVNETVTTYAYNSNNLLLTSETVAAGDGSSAATTSYAYDDIGNRVMVDGPRADVDDRSYTTYDALRRPVYEIGVDPDGSGSLQRAVIHHVYDVDGNEIRTETGTGSAITFDGDGVPTGVSDFAVTSFKRMTFDPSTGLLVKTEVVQP